MTWRLPRMLSTSLSTTFLYPSRVHLNGNTCETGGQQVTRRVKMWPRHSYTSASVNQFGRLDHQANTPFFAATTSSTRPFWATTYRRYCLRFFCTTTHTPSVKGVMSNSWPASAWTFY